MSGFRHREPERFADGIMMSLDLPVMCDSFGPLGDRRKRQLEGVIQPRAKEVAGVDVELRVQTSGPGFR
jgi:hypothetical protein